MRQWELEQTIRDPEFDINKALAEFFNGSDGSTESEELLQLPSGEDKQSGGWRYDRRDPGPRVQPDEERESEDCWCRHAREEDEESRREGVGD